MGWPEVLDELEARVAAHEAALASGARAPEAYQFPSDLGPLPEEQRPRAERLLDRYLALQAQVAHAKAKIGSALSRSQVDGVPAGQSASSAPAFVDSEA